MATASWITLAISTVFRLRYLIGAGECRSDGTHHRRANRYLFDGDGNVTNYGDITDDTATASIIGSGNRQQHRRYHMPGNNGIYIWGDGQRDQHRQYHRRLQTAFTYQGGDVTSTGDITAGLDGIYIDGTGNVTSNGDIIADGDGIYIDGTGNVTSTGNIDAGSDGKRSIDNGDVTSTGDITAGLDGIYIDGNGNVTTLIGDIVADESTASLSVATATSPTREPSTSPCRRNLHLWQRDSRQ